MRFKFAFSLVLALIAGNAFSQGPEESWGNLKQLRTGQQVQVVDMKLKTAEGTFLGFSEETISLRRGKQEMVFQRSEVSRVSVLGNRRKNSLIGASIGLIAGLTLGALSDFFDDVDRSDSGSNNGKLGGSAVGAAIGAGVGAAFHGHRTIYRAKPPVKD